MWFGGFLLMALVLRASPAWLTGVVGNYDAWQGLWNLQHADRFLRGESPLWYSDRVWFPEGASLVFHALSPGLTLPGALLAGLTGPFVAYNTLVLACFAFGAAFLHRLVRRLGASAPGAAVGALVFVLAPLYTTRVAAGHLNLLGVACFPAALEGLFLAARNSGRKRLGGVLLASGAMGFSVYVDYYLALLCALLLAVTGIFELAGLHGRERLGAAAAFAGAGLLSAILAWPLLSRVAHSPGRIEGHDPRELSVDAVALLVPGRAQLLGRSLAHLEGKPVPPEVEKNSYLCLVPLVALGIAVVRKPGRFLAGVMAACGAGLVLSLGPVLQLGGKATAVPLPYAWLVGLVPSLASGGGVNRFLLLFPVALSLAAGMVATGMLEGGKRRNRALLFVCTAVFVGEALPADPGVSSVPYYPPDSAMVAIAQAPERGAVLDLDPGIPNLFRQLRHQRPQVWGYLSRAPREAKERREGDPILGPLFRQEERHGQRLGPEITAFFLRDYWGIGFLTGPDCSPFIDRAMAFGFPIWQRSGLSFVFKVPEARPRRLSEVNLATPDLEGLRRGIRLEGFSAPGDDGRRMGVSAEAFFPAEPGRWEVELTEPSPGTARLLLSWGVTKRVETTLDGSGPARVTFVCSEEDLTPGGGLRLRFQAEAMEGGKPGVLVRTLFRR